MSFITESKARELLAEYMNAELSGKDARAIEIEDQLKKAGWKITVGPEGTTVVREGGGLFSGELVENVFLPKEQITTPYMGTPKNTSNNTGMIIGFSIAGVVIIISIIALVYYLKNRKNAIAG